jgi:hypothetical protein
MGEATVGVYDGLETVFPRLFERPMINSRMITAPLIALVLFVAVADAEAPQQVREWNDVSGRFLARGEFFASNDDTVVVRRRNGTLVGVELKDLSTADQEFVKERRAAIASAEPQPDALDQYQTWKSRSGFEVKGKIVAFGQRDIEFRRMQGLVMVNGTAFSRLPPFSQLTAIQIVAEFDDPSVKTEADLTRWAARLGNESRKYSVEGVLLKLEDGTELPVPFFMFSEEDLYALRPGYEQWKDSKASEESRAREDFLLQLQAEEHSRGRMESRQIEMMKLNLMAAATGVTTIWEVFLVPPPGVFARPMSVVVPARDSLQAQQMALAQYPGFRINATRSLSR